MAKNRSKAAGAALETIAKCPTGISGLDEITLGGLPRGRPTLVCGAAGCGKTLLGMEFLVRGATRFDEPGVCISFEETAGELTRNVASLGFDVDALVKSGKLAIDHVFLERSLIQETGEYDLEALFLRIADAVETVGAKRILIDSVESLFAGLSNEAILRSELRRLFRWLKERGLTAVITGERGNGTLTRHGLEEYISDCVILLDHLMADTVLTRRLRVVKYRGSTHGTNEYPFLIDQDGISILPVTSMELNHSVSLERVSTGVPALDEMFGGQGIYRGSSVLISGTAGTGKTSLSAQFVDAACARGERAILFSFEEAAGQVIRNMRSIGLDLERWIKKGLLQFHATRPTSLGLELHLVKIHKLVNDFAPAVVVVDPMNALVHAGGEAAGSMLLRLVDFFKGRGITALMTTLTSGGSAQERTDTEISSLIDTWLLLRDIESGGERNRGLYVLKARGLAHSNQIREFLLTSHGIEVRKAYLGETGMLTGSARMAEEAREASRALAENQEIERKQLLLARKRKALEAQIAALELEMEAGEQESRQIATQEETRRREGDRARQEIARSRHTMATPAANGRADRPKGGRK